MACRAVKTTLERDPPDSNHCEAGVSDNFSERACSSMVRAAWLITAWLGVRVSPGPPFSLYFERVGAIPYSKSTHHRSLRIPWFLLIQQKIRPAIQTDRIVHYGFSAMGSVADPHAFGVPAAVIGIWNAAVFEPAAWAGRRWWLVVAGTAVTAVGDCAADQAADNACSQSMRQSQHHHCGGGVRDRAVEAGRHGRSADDRDSPARQRCRRTRRRCRWQPARQGL